MSNAEFLAAAAVHASYFKPFRYEIRNEVYLFWFAEQPKPVLTMETRTATPTRIADAFAQLRCMVECSRAEQ